MKPTLLLLAGIALAQLVFNTDPLTAATAAENHPRVVMETSLGRMVIELYPDKAPITVRNFLDYVDAGFYNGTIFHRVIPGFVIQGGGFDAEMHRKDTRPPIKNEADNGLKNLRATLSMARTSDINSATSQFFINLKNNSSLDHGSHGFGYAVFAKVVEGFDTIDKIAAVRTTTRGYYRDVPVTPVVILKVYREKAAQQKQ